MPAIDESLLSLAQPAVVLPLAVALVALSTLVLVRLHVRMECRWRELLRGADGQSIELLLHEHLAERIRLQSEIDALAARLKRVEGESQSAKRHVGLVRFDAFDEVGGAQSFALAMVDDRGDGLVLSAIVGRETCRVFAKSLVAGRSERELSGEEIRALREAVESPRAVVGI